MQKQPKIAVIAGTAEAALAGGVAREVEFGRVLDRQHMPPDCTLAGKPRSSGQHFTMADRVVVEEATKCKRLVAVVRQGMNARRGLLAHRLQQTCTDTAETLITKAAQILLNHANRPHRQCSGYRITIRTDGKVDSHLCDHRSLQGIAAVTTSAGGEYMYQQFLWTGGTHNVGDPTAWSPAGLPGTGDQGFIVSGNALAIAQAVPGDIELGS